MHTHSKSETQKAWMQGDPNESQPTSITNKRSTEVVNTSLSLQVSNRESGADSHQTAIPLSNWEEVKLCPGKPYFFFSAGPTMT